MAAGEARVRVGGSLGDAVAVHIDLQDKSHCVLILNVFNDQRLLDAPRRGGDGSGVRHDCSFAMGAGIQDGAACSFPMAGISGTPRQVLGFRKLFQPHV